MGGTEDNVGKITDLLNKRITRRDLLKAGEDLIKLAALKTLAGGCGDTPTRVDPQGIPETGSDASGKRAKDIWAVQTREATIKQNALPEEPPARKP